MHPLGLCNNNDEEDLYEYGWVGVVKLEQPELDPSCLTVLGKVKKKKKTLVVYSLNFTVWCYLINNNVFSCNLHGSFYLPLLYMSSS